MTFKILLVLETCGGGSGRHVMDLAHALLNTGHDVHLAYSPMRMEKSFGERLENLKALRCLAVPMRREPHQSDLACILKVRKYVRTMAGFDIVHGHSSKGGAIARMAALGTKSAKIYTPHAFRTMDPTLTIGARLAVRSIERFLARYASDAVIAVSQKEFDHALEIGIPKNKLHLVLNGIPDLPEFDRATIRLSLGIKPEDVCVGFVGRFVPQKAPTHVIAAVAKVADDCPSLKLVMLGEGPMETEAHSLAKETGIAERVIWLTGKYGPSIMPAFDILTMPSRYEAMPYVLLEALAVGLPIIAMDVGGVSATIEPGVNGFIVPEGDIDCFAEKIRLLVQKGALREEMAWASSTKLKDFSIEWMISETVEIYRSALASKASTSKRLGLTLSC